MAKKHQFDASGDEAFCILGIFTGLKDYRLSYHLNKDLYLELAKLDDLQTPQGGYSFYFFKESGNYLSFYLIGNKGPGGVLIPDLKQADFFLVVSGPFSLESQDRFLKTIRQMAGIQTAAKIEVSRQKKIDTLLMELELHMVAIANRKKTANGTRSGKTR